MLLPQWLRRRIRRRRDEQLLFSMRFSRLAQWPAAMSAQVMPQAASAGALASHGVNLLGYISGQFGLGVSARAYTSALMEVGYPVAVFDSSIDIPHARDDRSLAVHLEAGGVRFDTTVVFVNPDRFTAALDAFGEHRPSGRLLGCWFWELPRVPEAWMDAVRQVDEIIVATEFVADAFRAVTDKPITRIPFPMLPASVSALTRADIDVPADAFVFLCTFDCNSSLDRKNPGAVIRAFRMAFPIERTDVFLLLKSSNGKRNPSALRALLQCTGGDPRIMLRDGVIDVSHVNALQSLSDCYVSLHRAEGLGLGMAESMRMGKPVVATGWSGNRDFMDDSNSYLVDYQLVPVLPGQYPHGEGQVWAEPDIRHAARHMRSVVQDSARAERIAEAGRATILREMSLEVSGRLFAAHLDSSAEFEHANRSDAVGKGTVPP
jgi:hypothetical protein